MKYEAVDMKVAKAEAKSDVGVTWQQLDAMTFCAWILADLNHNAKLKTVWMTKDTIATVIANGTLLNSESKSDQVPEHVL